MATSTNDPAVAPAVDAAMSAAMEQHHLRALIVQVRRDGQVLYTGALGESMTGVPATADMHVFNGAVAYTYLGQLLVMLTQEGVVGLDDTLDTHLPALPASNRITLRMLANSTSGYADFVYTPEVLRMNGYIVGPMGLRSTAPTVTSDVPPPVLHTWTSERRADLQIPADLPFYEDSTFFNASWTTPTGALMTTDIADLATTAEAVGSGRLVSPELYTAQTGNSLAGTGEKTAQCPVCAALTERRSYAFAILLSGAWMTQTKAFAGSGASIGYLPSEELSVAVITTLMPEAFDADGVGDPASGTVMAEIAAAVSDVSIG